jgi:hypothetical protein
MLARLRDHRFTAAEAYLERDIGDWHRKQRTHIGRRPPGKIKRQQR